MLNNKIPTMGGMARKLLNIVQRGAQQYEDDKFEDAYIGFMNFATSLWEINVPGKPNYVYATRIRTSPETPVEALNDAVVPSGGLAIKLERKNNEFIVHKNVQGANTFTGGGVNLNVGIHTHELEFGNGDPVSALRFKPLQAHIAEGGNSLFIVIEAGIYRYNDQDREYPKTYVNMTPYLPPTSGKQAWVKVGIDPTTNTAVAKRGTEYLKGYPLSSAELLPIAFDSNDELVIRSVGLKMRNGQTVISDWRDFYDLRPFATGMNAPSSGGGGSSDALFLSWTGGLE